MRVEELSPDEARRLEPRLSPELTAVYRLPELGQVRNPRLLKALIAACAERGVRMLPGTPVIGFDEREGEIAALRTPSGIYLAGRYCVAGGAWSRTILQSLGIRIAVQPVRGQIVLVSQVPRLFSHVLQLGPRYLVPRADGKVLIGATEEHVGFVKSNTAAVVSDLLAFGASLVPSLGGARFERAWSGLRPGSADGLPYLGPRCAGTRTCSSQRGTSAAACRCRRGRPACCGSRCWTRSQTCRWNPFRASGRVGAVGKLPQGEL